MRLRLKKWSSGGFVREDAEREAAEEIERQVGMGKPSPEEWAELEARLLATPPAEPLVAAEPVAVAEATTSPSPEAEVAPKAKPRSRPAPKATATRTAPRIAAPKAAASAKTAKPAQRRPRSTGPKAAVAAKPAARARKPV